MTAEELDTSEEGTLVRDATGDTWVKIGGTWICYDANMDSASLLEVWGPITPSRVL